MFNWYYPTKPGINVSTQSAQSQRDVFFDSYSGFTNGTK
jgi:hypothetical protein